MGLAENETGERAPAELPGRNERLALMVALACLAVFLSQRPAPQPVDPAQVATQYLDAAGAQPAAANPEAAAPVAEQPASALASTEEPANADRVPATASDATPTPDEPAPEPAAEESDAESEPDPGTESASSEPAAEEPAADEPTAEESELGGVFSDPFEAENADWSSMTGSWAVEDGRLVQSNAEGFDYINQLSFQVPAEYSVSVRMEALSTSLGGGIVIGQPALGSRRGAYSIDFTAEGTFLRWGRYDPESGAYTYIGGLNVGTDGVGPHVVAVEALTDTTLVYLDDTYIGAFDAVDPGYVGLITSQSAVAFDDFIVDELS